MPQRSPVRSNEWDLPVAKVREDLAYTVAIERYTPSRDGRARACRVRDDDPKPPRPSGDSMTTPTVHQGLVFDHQPLGSVVGVILVKVGLVYVEADNVQGLG